MTLPNTAYRNIIFLAGCGRSGTTWLAELINYKNDFRFLFEPFHNQNVKEWSAFNYRQYLRGKENDPALKKAVKAIISGGIRNKWTDKFWDGQPRQKLLIKDIRANLVLKWIKVHYSRIPVILMIRYPGSVINSRLKLGWSFVLEDLLKQPQLVEDHLKQILDQINIGALSLVEQHALTWCIENYVPLKQFRRNEILVVFYENLILDPENQLKKIFRYIHKPFDKAILQSFEKPSALSKKHSAILAPNKDLILGWKKEIPAEDQEAIERMMKIFGLDLLYGPDCTPQPGNLGRLHKRNFLEWPDLFRKRFHRH